MITNFYIKDKEKSEDYKWIILETKNIDCIPQVRTFVISSKGNFYVCAIFFNLDKNEYNVYLKRYYTTKDTESNEEK